jgi:hypothetical protein
MLLLLAPHNYSFASDYDDYDGGGPMYKSFSLTQDAGYFAREFDKNTVPPGVDWTGDSDSWMSNARANGWVTETSPEQAKVGALIIGNQYPTGIWVGIVRNVSDSAVSYEAFNNKGKSVLIVKKFDSLKDSLLGYILPEKL